MSRIRVIAIALIWALSMQPLAWAGPTCCCVEAPPADTPEIQGEQEHACGACCDSESPGDSPADQEEQEDNSCDCPMPCCNGLSKVPAQMSLPQGLSFASAGAGLAVELSQDLCPRDGSRGLIRPPKA